MRWQQKWEADMRDRVEVERERRDGGRKRAPRKRSTYNRKQRNLACSDSDFRELIAERARSVRG